MPPIRLRIRGGGGTLNLGLGCRPLNPNTNPNTNAKCKSNPNPSPGVINGSNNYKSDPTNPNAEPTSPNPNADPNNANLTLTLALALTLVRQVKIGYSVILDHYLKSETLFLADELEEEAALWVEIIDYLKWACEPIMESADYDHEDDGNVTGKDNENEDFPNIEDCWEEYGLPDPKLRLVEEASRASCEREAWSKVSKASIILEPYPKPAPSPLPRSRNPS